MWRLSGTTQQVLLHHKHHGLVLQKRTMMATSRQKRALNQKKLQGASGDGKGGKAPAQAAPAASKPAAAATPPPPPTAPPAGGGGSGSLAFVLGGGALIAGGLAYAYYEDIPLKLPWEQEEKKPSVREEEPKSEDSATAKDAATTKEEQDSAEQDSVVLGNRVIQIEMPANMQNKSTTTAPAEEPPPHPAQGHRVSMNFVSKQQQAATEEEAAAKKKKKKKKKKDVDGDMSDASPTQRALEQLQSGASVEAAEALLQSHQALWTTLASTNFDDLDELAPSQLKTRYVALLTEMKDRTRWEAVRLKEFLALKEKEASQKYTELFQKQRLEFEEILAKRLREQEGGLQQKFREALEQKDASIQSVVDAALAAQQEEHDQDKEAFASKFQSETQIELNKQYGEQMATYKQAMERDLQDKVATLANLSAMLSKLKAALEASERHQEGSSQAHKLSAAALALSEILETHTPAAAEVHALQRAAGQDGVIATAVRTLPESVLQGEGVPTLSELQTKFDEQYSTFRQAALVPTGRPGLDGQLAGMLFASLKYPPQADDPVPEGADETSQAEYVLARARKHVQLGELSQAVDELEKLPAATQQVNFVIADWKKAAMDRVAVDKAIKVIKLECALLHESISE